jgi:tricorn protease-like protein
MAKINMNFSCIGLGFLFLLTACNEKDPASYLRYDNAYKINIPIDGSKQNPAFSPDGKSIVFTRFRGGYNKEPADIMIINLETNEIDTLVMDGSANVNLPGACWNSLNNNIVFSSSREPHDEIYVIEDTGQPGDEIQVTERSDYMAYELHFPRRGVDRFRIASC